MALAFASNEHMNGKTVRMNGNMNSGKVSPWFKAVIVFWKPNERFMHWNFEEWIEFWVL